MKKLYKLTALLTAAALALPAAMPVRAEEDYSNTDEWYARCTQVQTSQEGVNACQGFKEYQQQRKQALNNSIAELNNNISALDAQTDQVAALAQEQQDLYNQLQVEISQQQAAIAQIEENIAQTQEQIDQKQAEIDVWDGQIKSRMKKEQASTGTNTMVDLVMGSRSLSDLLRRVAGIERITESDQKQIEQLNQMKADLEFSKSELERLSQEKQDELASLEEQQAQAAALEASYQQLIAQYQAMIDDYEAQMREAQADADAIQDFAISVNLASSLDYSGISVNSAGFVNPVPAARISAGTWAYPGGARHLGLDLAAPIGSALIAPADGLVIYASNNAPSNGGFLGNFTGYPYGSGNCIEMLTNVNGTTYAILFCHLSQDFYVSAGSVVSQGQTMALTGNSGNSTGPHTHVEIYNLGSMSLDQAAARFASTKDHAFGTGWSGTSTACEVSGSTPCRERPEGFF